MAISNIKKAAESVGITAIISNSREKIETQLNRITGHELLPIMLVSWDLETQLSFNENGFLNNPNTDVVVLLMTKAESKEVESYEAAAEEMALLYQQFLQHLNSDLIQFSLQNTIPITNIGHTLVPRHGLGVHSGIIGRFTMIDKVANCKC